MASGDVTVVFTPIGKIIGVRWFFARLVAARLPHLALFAVMLLALGLQASSYWECEGQRCGITPWACCCANLTDTRDADCRAARQHLTGARHAKEQSVCALDCHCQMVVQSAGPIQHSSPFSFVAPLLIVTPCGWMPTCEAPMFIETSRPQPARGPPSLAVYSHTAPRRGPPIRLMIFRT